MNAVPWPPILVITDRRQCAESLEIRAEALFHGGCRWLSLREKDLEPGERRALLDRLALSARRFDATICVHDDVAAALSTGAGLHLPAHGDPAEARRALGPDPLIGQSCHSRAEISAALAAGADYVTMGPAFATPSKPGYRPTALLADEIAGMAIPILALGGITPRTLPTLPPGLSGVAIMGAAMTAPDPAAWFTRIQVEWLKRAPHSDQRDADFFSS